MGSKYNFSLVVGQPSETSTSPTKAVIGDLTTATIANGMDTKDAKLAHELVKKVFDMETKRPYIDAIDFIEGHFTTAEGKVRYPIQYVPELVYLSALELLCRSLTADPKDDFTPGELETILQVQIGISRAFLYFATKIKPEDRDLIAQNLNYEKAIVTRLFALRPKDHHEDFGGASTNSQLEPHADLIVLDAMTYAENYLKAGSNNVGLEVS